MKSLAFTADENGRGVRGVKLYLQEEINREISGFDAQFPIDFRARKMGAWFYYRGLHDNQALFSRKVE